MGYIDNLVITVDEQADQIKVLLAQRNKLANFMEDHLHVESTSVNELCQEAQKEALREAGYDSDEAAEYNQIALPFADEDGL